MESQNHQNHLPNEIQEIFNRAKNLRELTYSYIDIWDKISFNTTLFIDYLWAPEQLKNKKTLNS